MTFQNQHPRLLALLLSASVFFGGCRLQLEPPGPPPNPPPQPTPVDPTPQPGPVPTPAPSKEREAEFYSALARAVREGEFVDTDHLFAFSKHYREKHNIPPGGEIASREFSDITANRPLDMQSIREDIAARLERIADAKLKGD